MYSNICHYSVLVVGIVRFLSLEGPIFKGFKGCGNFYDVVFALLNYLLGEKKFVIPSQFDFMYVSIFLQLKRCVCKIGR